MEKRNDGPGVGHMSSTEVYLRGSQIYDPVALLRRESEILIVARVGMKASRRFMILTPAAEPAWPHEPLSSLSDVAWALRAHEWHRVVPQPVGQNLRPAKALARLLADGA
jgi:hypothetical protein